MALKSDFLDFSYTEFKRLSEPKELIIENKFGFDIECAWVLLPVISKTTGV